MNDFFTQTEWLPRADHFWLGESLLGDTFTWYEHSSAGYARFQRATAPTNPADTPFQYLPWELNSRQGAQFTTRQELDWPFQLGVVKVVPYALGELAYWGEDINGDSMKRAYYQLGLRASMPMWSVNPNVEDDLFNVHGLAHKIVYKTEFAFSESSADFSLLPLYNQVDDDNIEAERRRFIVYTFNSTLPQKFDERYYALRYGLGSSVATTNSEIADDLTTLKIGAEQRWQTKRGMPGNQHIIDWITFDTHLTLFPEPDRDDYGAVAGLIDYDFRWHVGDRTTLVSSGLFDTFSEGSKIVSVGGFLTRPPRGSAYIGYTHIDGPIQNRILTASYTYWMSPKWISSIGTSVDFGKEGNIGEHISITRVGESLLINAGFNVDPVHGTWGVNFNIEPRFVSKSRLTHTGGVIVPPAGANGME